MTVPRCRNRERKDRRNQKGRTRLISVGEEKKPDSCSCFHKETSIVGRLDIGTHFQIAFHPEGALGEPPTFKRIEEVIRDGVGKIHNCLNLTDNKTAWLPPAMPVIIIKNFTI